MGTLVNSIKRTLVEPFNNDFLQPNSLTTCSIFTFKTGLEKLDFFFKCGKLDKHPEILGKKSENLGKKGKKLGKNGEKLGKKIGEIEEK